MKKYIFQRIIQSFVCVVSITIIVFFLTRISGDPVLLMVPPEATAEDIEKMRETLGLKEPIYVQYWKFISKARARAARIPFGKKFHPPTMAKARKKRSGRWMSWRGRDIN